MTDVLFDYTKPDSSGNEIPVRVKLRFALLNREEDGTGTVLTNWFDKTVYGPTLVGLIPTQTGQAWQMIEVGGSVGRPGVQTFLVPNSATPLEFEDLVHVDPKTLGEIDMTGPAWVEAIEDLDERVTVIENLGFPPHTHPISDVVDLQNALGRTHDQTVASATWNITHNLPYMPSVTIVDSAGTVVIGEVRYPTNTTVQVLFSGAFSGKAYLS